MKIILLLCSITFALSISAQKKLFYFVGKDSLVGVKDNTGAILIPAIHTEKDFYDFDNPITGDLINLWLPKDDKKYKNSFGVYYNRQGKYLCHPYRFDNGPDYLQEGFFRFVENNKIGFASRFGEKKIMAKYDFAAPFLMGTAVVCTGCSFDIKKDPEHPPLINGTYSFIDYTGKVLQNNIKFSATVNFWDKLDSIRQQLYKKQFVYTPFEKKLIDKFKPYKASIEKKYYSNPSKNLKQELEFQIVEKPFLGFPFYVVHAFEKIGKQVNATDPFDLEFYISKDGNKLFNHSNFDGNIPFDTWLKDYLKK